MTRRLARTAQTIPTVALYGENGGFPDILHCERITDRAAPNDWVIAPHRHADLCQIFLVRGGSFTLGVDGGTRDIEAPVVLCIPPRLVHEFRFARDTDGFVLTLPVSEFREAFATADPAAERLSRLGHAPVGAPLFALAETLIEALKASTAGRRLRLVGLAYQLLGAVAEVLPDPGRSDPGSDSHRHLLVFEELLRQNLARGWTVVDYARAMGITPTHLSRVARAAAGIPASRLIEAAFVREASRELAYTRKRIDLVAYDLGFQDPSYFSRRFRRATGQSPLSYRRRLNEGQP